MSGAQQGGYALQFDGTSKIVTIPDNSSIQFNGNSPFTIEAWVKPTGEVGPSGWSILIDKLVHNASGSWTNGITDSQTGLTLGRRPSAASDTQFFGFLDKVHIWNIARTEAEIKAGIYKEIGTQTNLKAYYQ